MFFQGNEKYNCATYLRLSRSDGDQQESNSIKNQRALLNDYMGKHPELHKFDEYVDDGYSGTNFERPDFKRMIQEIREKKQEALKHDTLLPTWLEEFKQYEHIKTLERRVVVELIDHIDVHSKTEIEIHFCFEDELHSITEKFMEYQAHHGNEVAEE